jgi:PKD repeat protein
MEMSRNRKQSFDLQLISELGNTYSPGQPLLTGKTILNSSRGGILLILLAALLIVAIPPPAHSDTQTPVQLGVFIDTYRTTNVTDPDLAPNQPGGEINVTVRVSNLPDIASSSAGGLQGFDISLNYSTIVYRILGYDYNGPNCSRDDTCVYANTTQSNSLVFNSTVDSNQGILHLAMVVLDPSLRAHGSGVLFKVHFQIIGRGKSQFSIMQSSRLFGYSNNCGLLLAYTATSAWIDNRRPYRITADPPPSPFPVGQKVSVKVTVWKVNAFGDGYVTLILSNWPGPQGANYSFAPRTDQLSSSQHITNFNSTMTLYTPAGTPQATYYPEIIAHLNTTFDQSYEARFTYPVTVGAGYTLSSSPPIPAQAQSAALTTPYLDTPSDAPLPFLASFTATTATVGVPVSFTPTVCGGTSPYRLHWGFGDRSANSTSLDAPGIAAPTTHTYASPGQYTVSLNITDSMGLTLTASRTLSVTGNPSTSPDAIRTILLVTIIPLILLGALMYFRRGRSRRS